VACVFWKLLISTPPELPVLYFSPSFPDVIPDILSPESKGLPEFSRKKIPQADHYRNRQIETFDGLAKNRRNPNFVIPYGRPFDFVELKEGIHSDAVCRP
jgi:hypothetical protein